MSTTSEDRWFWRYGGTHTLLFRFELFSLLSRARDYHTFASKVVLIVAGNKYCKWSLLKKVWTLLNKVK